MAQSYAERCVFQHNPERSIQQAALLYTYVGENLAITSNPKKNYTELIKSWFQEREYYDYETNSCLPGQMCGHYTQVCSDPSPQTTRFGHTGVRSPPLLSDRSFGQAPVTWDVVFTDAGVLSVSAILIR